MSSTMRDANILITGARVYTADPQRPWAAAIAIQGNRILYVGNAAEARARAGTAAEEICVPGGLAVPGLKAGIKSGTVLTYTYADPYGPLGLLLQAQLAQLGITLKLQHLDEAIFSTIFYGNEPASKRPNLMPWGWWPDYNDPYDECVPLVASYSYNAGNGGYYHNKEVDALLADMQNVPRERLIDDAHKLQDITGRVDPSAIWAYQPADVTVMTRSLHGFVFNPLAIGSYAFYPMYRS